MIGFNEILIILIVGALVFGAKRIPDIGSSLGHGIKNFRKSMRDDTPQTDPHDDIAPSRRE